MKALDQSVIFCPLICHVINRHFNSVSVVFFLPFPAMNFIKICRGSKGATGGLRGKDEEREGERARVRVRERMRVKVKEGFPDLVTQADVGSCRVITLLMCRFFLERSRPHGAGDALLVRIVSLR